MNKEIIRLALTLLTVCGISAACVGFAHSRTQPVIEERQAREIEAGYREVLPDAGSLKPVAAKDRHILGIMRSEKYGSVSGYIYTAWGDGYGGRVTVMVGIEHPEGRISSVKVLQHHETPGLGAKCTEPAFLGQFTGKDFARKLKVTKASGAGSHEIQVITASTITSGAVVQAVNAARSHYLHNFASGKGE